MTNFVNNLKAALKKHDRNNLVFEVQNNPEYAQVLSKLAELNDKREELYRELGKLELDIDACLVLIEVKRQKDEINKY